LSEEEFRKLNLKQFDALLKRKYENKKNEKKKADYRAGIVAATIANVFRDKKQKPFKPDDFMPKEKKKQDWQTQLQVVEMLNKALGGKDKRGGND